MKRWGKTAAREMGRRGLSLLARRPLSGLILIILALGLSWTAGRLSAPEPSASPESGFREINGVVTRVGDGDSLTLKTDRGDSVKVRLFGVDAPELAQKRGREAHQYLRGLAEGRRARVEVKTVDQYDRQVGRVFVDGRCLNEILVTEGQAWVFERYCQDGWCDELRRAQARAQSERRGLWQDRDPQPPWDWRRENPRH